MWKHCKIFILSALNDVDMRSDVILSLNGNIL